MKKPNVEEVLQQGIHGALETLPDERRKFLGTLRERTILALKKNQVTEATIYPQVEREMKKNPQVNLYLNGNIEYAALSKYVKLAAKHNIEHKIVTNKEHDTEIGLLLAMDHAIDKEEIYITQKEISQPEPQKSKGLFAKLFKR